MHEKLLEFQKVSKTYRDDPLAKGAYVLKDISFSLNSGERVALVGPNGSGKSTFLQIALGLLAPDAGLVTSAAENAHYIPQDYRSAVFPWLSLRRHIELFCGQGQIGAGNAAFEDLSVSLGVSYDLTRFPYQLSGGEQQIFLLALAMLRGPRLLVLDEAFSAIDFHRRATIFDVLANWAVAGRVAILCVEHDVEQAIALVDRVVVLARDTAEIVANVEIVAEQPRPYEWKYSEECRSYSRAIEKYFYV